MNTEFLRRLLDALLRENHLGMSANGYLGDGWWAAVLDNGVTVRLPVRQGGFLSDWEVAEPLLIADGATVSTVDGVLEVLAPHGDPEAEAGWAQFRLECAQTLAAPFTELDLSGSAASGFTGLVHHEAAAALREHPVHPTGRCRWGLSDAEQRAYAPEYLPTVRLKWTVVPRSRLRLSAALRAELPSWWPQAPGSDVIAMPVHPLTAAREGLSTMDVDGPAAVPTLSTRTLALADDPRVHVKLPMPTATLGARNKRTIKAGTLPDGETTHRLLHAVLDAEPTLAGRVLLADESRWVESDDELLAVLIREFPAEVAGDHLVPAAALLAPDPYGIAPRVIDRLAGDRLDEFFDEYLTTLLDWHVALWLRYGVALEAHQQNITVAVAADGRIRLVYKDNDGSRLDPARLSSALGKPVLAEDFADPRIVIGDPGELADMFTTITLHLCVAAPIVELAGTDRRRRAELFDLARTRLTEALHRWSDPSDPGGRAAAEMLRTAVLDADRLPIKAMLTSGTLLPKQRIGCTDINKYYLRTGPNYLKAVR